MQASLLDYLDGWESLVGMYQLRRISEVTVADSVLWERIEMATTWISGMISWS